MAATQCAQAQLAAMRTSARANCAVEPASSPLPCFDIVLACFLQDILIEGLPLFLFFLCGWICSAPVPKVPTHQQQQPVLDTWIAYRHQHSTHITADSRHAPTRTRTSPV